MKMAGPAVTVKCHPADNLTIHKAVATAEPGSVLVIDCGGFTARGVFGELFAVSCVAHQIAGVVIDGACRDREELIDMNFPVFSRGVNPNGTRKEVCGVVNQPITCGGIVVNPGDIIVGDADGVVRIAKECAEDVLQKAKAKQAKEDDLRKALAAGKTTLELLDLGKKCGMEG